MNNTNIEKGFEALRSEELDPTAAHRALKTLRKPRKRFDWRFASVPVAGMLLTAAFLATSRTSNASVIRTILNTLRSSKHWVATNYVRDSQNREVVSMRIASDGTTYKATFSPEADVKAVALVGGRRVSFRTDCTVIDDNGVWFDQAPETILDGLLKNELVTGVTTKKELDHGRIFDVYEVMWKQGSAEGRTGTIDLYTEAGTKRPVRMLGVAGNSLGLHSEWQYDDIPRELLDASIPQSLPCYDLAAQRHDFEERLKEVSSRAGGKMQVIGVWVDHSGGVVVMTAGDAGLPASGKITVSISGIGAGSTAGFAWNSVEAHGGVNWCVPTTFQGVPTMAHTARFAGTIPNDVTLNIQVWANLNPKSVGDLSWHGTVNRTYSLSDLFAPEVKPYFLSEGRSAPPNPQAK